MACQFVLEELDAARNGSSFIQDKIKSFYINSSDYIGAMQKSWGDVDGSNGPQQFLLHFTIDLSKKFGLETASIVRLSIVECIIKHYRFGRFFIDTNFRETNYPLNLFQICVRNDQLHPHYKKIMTNEYKSVREVIDRWASGFEDRDNKLSKEFQTTFNSSFWEIYLYQCFKDLNLTVDFSKASPDFYLKSINGETFNVEATTANHAQDSEPEWSDIKDNINDDKKFLDFACIRILNALKSKHTKYLNTYSKYEHVQNNPYVIAIAPFEQPFFSTQNNEAIIRVLYAQGINKFKGFTEEEVPFVMKNSNIPLDLGVFTNEKFKEISAVIFSTTATIGKAITQSELKCDVRVSRYHETKELISEFISNDKHFETHLDGLQVHHNPYAKIKLNPDLFNKYEVTHYYYDTINKKVDNQQKSYSIISRNPFLFF